MLAAFSQKAGQIIRNLLPLETAVVFIFLTVMSWPIPYFGVVSPLLGLVAIYYWAIYRPDLLRPYLVFILGILNDAVNDLPLGLSAFVYLGVYQIAFISRRFFVGQVFYMLWFGFLVLVLLAMIASWAFLSVIHWQIMTVVPILLQHLLTIVLFPLPAWVLNRLQRVCLTQG